MNTPQKQIKINIPEPLMDFLVSRARRYGLPIAGYVKHLIMKDAERIEYPTFEASERVEEAYKKAKKAEEQGKLIKMNK